MYFFFRPERKVILIISLVAFMGLGLLGYRAVYATGDRGVVVEKSKGPESSRPDTATRMDKSHGATETGGGCEPPEIIVHVCGEVKRPGVYGLSGSARVNDAVNAAGGATDSACLDAVNLALPVSDGQQVYIPPKPKPQRSEGVPDAASGKLPVRTKGGDQSYAAGGSRMTDSSAKMVPQSKVVPQLNGTASNPGGIAQSDNVMEMMSSGQSSVASNPRLPDSLQEGLAAININTSSEEELMELKGVGPVLAERIIEYRTRNGRFSAPEDLLNVPGIGPKKFEAMRPYITVY